MTRLQFLRSLAGFGLAAVAVPTLAACQKQDDPLPPDASGGGMQTPDASASGSPDAGIDGSMQPPTCATTSAAIGTNHGHSMTVSAADVTAGVDKTYQIQGTSQHPHAVVLTAAHFATLRQTGTVTVTSSTDAMHSHSVTVTCAS